MEKLVWNKVREFLEVLRCEDIDRESIVETRELQEAKQILSDKNVVYQQSIANVRIEEQEKIKGYVNALREYSFEECQQAYVQGLVDCMLIKKQSSVFTRKVSLIFLIWSSCRISCRNRF